MILFDKSKILGKDKKQEASKDESFKRLEEFSEDLMGLAKEIEQKLEKKRELEAKMGEKNELVGKLRTELFELKEELMEANLELTRLERKMEKAEETNGN